jgi:hypothetical protein
MEPSPRWVGRVVHVVIFGGPLIRLGDWVEAIRVGRRLCHRWRIRLWSGFDQMR